MAVHSGGGIPDRAPQSETARPTSLTRRADLPVASSVVVVAPSRMTTCHRRAPTRGAPTIDVGVCPARCPHAATT
jgi:hypothetical protein